MRNMMVIVFVLAQLTCLAARAETNPPAPRELCRIVGPAGNTFVVTRTRVDDTGALAGFWPERRAGELAAVDCIQVQAVQKDKPAIVIGAYMLLVRHADPETGIEVLATLLEPHYLWLVVREGSEILVRRFSVGGGFIDIMGVGPWSSYTTPAPRRMGAATATIRRDGDSVVVDIEDRQSPTAITRSRSIWRKGQSGFESLYTNVDPIPRGQGGDKDR